jgi:ADP-ribose pyrophosphatase YjhB (NUDIX family)
MSNDTRSTRHPKYPPGLDISGTNQVSDIPHLPPLGNVRTLIRTCGDRSVKKKEPILSCGIICFRKIKGVIYVLLIRRKDSLAYVEFVRGKYKPSDPHYIRQLVDGMTKTERERILNHEFSELWKTMWISRSYKRHRPEYDKSKSRFDSIKGNLREYIEANPEMGWEEPEWGFPKGRPNRRETIHECAIREFQEETGIHRSKLTIIPSPEYEEDYTGTNGILYRNKYIVGTCVENDVGVNPRNRHQMKEISAVRWIPVNSAPDFIRHTYPSRLVILENSVKWFEENYNDK